MSDRFIDITSENIDSEHLCCIIRTKKPHPGVETKRAWLRDRVGEGHVFRKLDEKACVFIEYAPLESAWVTIVGDNYIYIYCLWVLSENKGKGYGRRLMESCITDAKADSYKYPCIFVHGILGYGDNDKLNSVTPYWGMQYKEDLMKSLNARGYDCHAASVGPLSSAWDRACELYAQLAGTVVDYGAAHSAEHHHERYGRSFVGKALIDTFGKTDKNGNIIKINLFGHSFGGATTRLFTYILANGAPEEVAAGGDVSEFFKGGKGDYVNSVISIAAPHNGTVSGNVGIAVYHGEYIAAMIANVAGMAGSNYLDLKLDQFGLTRAPGEGKASFNLCGILNYALSNDNCLYDLTLHGAQELNAKIGAVENVYYFSYACCGTEPSADGRFQNPTDALGSMAGTGWLIGHIAGITVDGVKLEGDWLRNDGAVPVKSALYPEGEKHEFIVDHKGAYERGVWYVYPVVENANHSTLLGSKTESYIDLYMNQIDIVNAK